MAFETPTRIEKQNLESVQRSLIKPNLFNLSGSGSMLNGVINECNLELPNVKLNNALGKVVKDVIVLHSGSSASLEWKIDGSHKTSLFSAGDAIINPTGLFVAPRWSAEVEILLIGIDPVLITRIAEQMKRYSGLEMIPHFQFRDELLCSLALSFIAEFEKDVPCDPVYAESLTHTLIAHLIRWYSVAGSKPLPANRGLSVHKLALVKDYINEHLSEVLSLSALAKVA